MVSIASVAAAGADIQSVPSDIDAQLESAAAYRNFVYAFHGCDHDDETIRGWLR